MWTDLSMRNLLAFRAVVEEGTFGNAAKRLGYSQSAVSQQVAVVEKLVGSNLLQRHPGPVKPTVTPAGELFMQWATRMIETVENAERDLERFKRGVTGTLTIGTFQSISTVVLPPAISKLREHAPNASVGFLNLQDQVSADDFWEANCDLGFLVGDVGPDLDAEFLGADPHVALFPPGSPDTTLDLRELSGTPAVGMPGGDSCMVSIERHLERLGVTPDFQFRSADNGAVQGMVKAGIGWAIMPLLAIDQEDSAVVFRKIEPPIPPRKISIAWPSESELSPLARHFISYCKDVCNSLLNRDQLQKF